MNRDEAMLRELNLYPLWVRREAAPAMAEPAVAVTIAPAASGAEVARLEQPAPSVELPVGKDGGCADPGWPELKARVQGCSACALREGCKQTVFGVGDEQADWLFVGEGPGAEEDEQGEPFVGQAGQLLDNMLMAIKLKRGKNVYIANVVKCRPPDNRTPAAEEIRQCLPYLQRQIQLLKPKVIVALGKTAAMSLMGTDATLGSLRGRVHDYHDTPLIVTYHPAYLLRTPTDKAKAWQDLRLAVATMNGLN